MSERLTCLSFLTQAKQVYQTFSSLCRFGRRFVVLHSVLFLLLFGVGAAFSPNIYVYMVLNFCSGIMSSGIFVNAFVIGM